MPPKVQLPSADEAADDPIQAQYGGPSGVPSLVEEAPSAPSGPAPETVGSRPGGSKWTRREATEFLLAQPKLMVYLPLSRDEEGRDGPFYQQVIWNGWAVPVPKGRSVMVPAPIAEIVNQANERYHTTQARTSRAVDMMLITPDRPGGLLIEEYSDPVAVELLRRGAPLRED